MKKFEVIFYIIGFTLLGFAIGFILPEGHTAGMGMPSFKCSGKFDNYPNSAQQFNFVCGPVK